MWSQLDSGFLCFVSFFLICPKLNAVYNCKSRSILEAVFQHLERHFLPVPVPCDGWTHSISGSQAWLVQCQCWDFNLFFFSFLLFAFCSTAWEHRLTLYPWPDSLAKNSSHIATWVQSHWRHVAAGKQGGQISPCSQNQTHKRSTENFVCLPPFRTAEQGEEVGTSVPWANISSLLMTLTWAGSLHTEAHLLSWMGLFPKGSCILTAHPAKNRAGWGQQAVLISISWTLLRTMRCLR